MIASLIAVTGLAVLHSAVVNAESNNYCNVASERFVCDESCGGFYFCGNNNQKGATIQCGAKYGGNYCNSFGALPVGTVTPCSASPAPCFSKATPPNPCSTTTCSGHGVCTASGTTTKCACEEGFTGDNCESLGVKTCRDYPNTRQFGGFYNGNNLKDVLLQNTTTITMDGNGYFPVKDSLSCHNACQTVQKCKQAIYRKGDSKCQMLLSSFLAGDEDSGYDSVVCDNLGGNDICVTKIDAVILLDGSGSIQTSDYELDRQFVRDFISRFRLSEELARISIVQFSDNTVVQADLVGDLTTAALAINQPQMKQSTGTIAAMNTVADLLAKQSRAQLNVPTVTFLVTDGAQSDGTDAQFLAAADRVKAMGRFFILGVGQASQKAEMLKQAVTQPAENYYAPVAQFKDINSVLDYLTSSVCLQVSGLPNNRGCSYGGTYVKIDGRGFLNAASDVNKIQCQFGDSTPVNAEILNDLQIACYSPRYNGVFASSVTVDIKVLSAGPSGSNEITATPLRFTYEKCLGWLIALLAILLLLLLLSCCGFVYYKSKQLPEESDYARANSGDNLEAEMPKNLPPVKPAPPASAVKVSKWEGQISNTNYLWKNEGGATAPLRVDWGKDGAPEAAKHLRGDGRTNAGVAPARRAIKSLKGMATATKKVYNQNFILGSVFLVVLIIVTVALLIVFLA
jgi:uncharacterized protein YegL